MVANIYKYVCYILLCRLCEKAGDELSLLFLPQMAHYQYVEFLIRTYLIGNRHAVEIHSMFTIGFHTQMHTFSY